MKDYYSFLQNEIGKVMKSGLRNLELPMKVEGHKDLICRLTIEIPRAVMVSGPPENRIWHHGIWSVEKQMIVWDRK